MLSRLCESDRIKFAHLDGFGLARAGGTEGVSSAVQVHCRGQGEDATVGQRRHHQSPIVALESGRRTPYSSLHIMKMAREGGGVAYSSHRRRTVSTIHFATFLLGAQKLKAFFPPLKTKAYDHRHETDAVLAWYS